MNSTQPARATVSQPLVPSAPSTTENAVKSAPQPASVKNKGFGLPCAKCRTYYSADVKSCPVCKSPERVSAKAAPVRSTVKAEELPDPVVLEEERERFLREFKAQVFASQATNTPVAPTRCSKEENHHGVPSEPAAVCQSCTDQLQERIDVLEAALQIDLKDAAQIVYDAVWSDPSDSSKTYQNAAHALLTELRRRSGTTQTFRPIQPLMD